MRIAATALVVLFLHAGVVDAQPLKGRAVAVQGMPEKTDNLSAVVVIGDRVILADDEQRQLLVGRRQADGTLAIGAPAALIGPGEGEFDLEGIAVSGDVVYAIGSHSAARRSADDKGRTQARNLERMQERVREAPERQVLFRLQLGQDGGVKGQPTSALQEIIKTEAHRGDKTEGLLARALGAPGKENGVDIEGLAVEGTTIWVGFRGPVLRHGYVPVLRVNAASFPALSREDLLFVVLGGRGIRDLVRVSGGFLVLAGALGDSDQSTQLVIWDGRSCVAGKDVPACVTKVLGEVPAVSGVDGDGAATVGRAEGVAVLEDSPASLRVLVVFDGVQGGAPTEYVIKR
jgi:Protein of unknown function (DUF3616)